MKRKEGMIYKRVIKCFFLLKKVEFFEKRKSAIKINSINMVTKTMKKSNVSLTDKKVIAVKEIPKIK
jgi:hypothetical protein